MYVCRCNSHTLSCCHSHIEELGSSASMVHDYYFPDFLSKQLMTYIYNMLMWHIWLICILMGYIYIELKTSGKKNNMKPRSLVLLVSRSEKWFAMPGNQFQPACQLRRRSLPFSGSSYWPCGEKATNFNVVNASPLIFHRGLTVQNDSRIGFWHGLYNIPLWLCQ